jgi:hypothetical protein
MLTVFAGLAQMERDIIRERTIAGLAAARARGLWKTFANLGCVVLRVTSLGRGNKCGTPQGGVANPLLAIVDRMAAELNNKAPAAWTPKQRRAHQAHLGGVNDPPLREVAHIRRPRSEAKPLREFPPCLASVLSRFKLCNGRK